jgi:hypothetical protein
LKLSRDERLVWPVGYPMVNVRDILNGKVWATRELFRAD